jgi:dihydroorotase
MMRHIIGAAICSVVPPWEYLLAPQKGKLPTYDLLIRGGHVIDPSQGLSAVRDVAISRGRVARITAEIAEADAGQILDARGKFVTPGLIDLHVHVYDGVAPLSIPADPNCIAKGVTSVLDAGSAGAHTFPGLRKTIINVVDTRVFALLNISVVGQSTFSSDNPYGELLNLNYANPKLTIRTIERNRDVILGVKVRLSKFAAGEKDLEALSLAKEASAAVGLPLMAHIGGTQSPLKDILAMLDTGDVVTHSYHGRDGGVLDTRGRVLPEVRSAVERGVNFDVGHGAGSFSFDVAEKAIAQELLPGTISSDVHHYNVHGPVFDLATTLSKFLYLGLTLEQVIERAASNPANTFGFPEGLGTLGEGSEADVSVFSLEEGNFELIDAQGESRTGQRRLIPVATVKAGKIYGSASIPVAETRGF